MERSKSIIRVSIVGILANLLLVAFKAAVGVVTGSIAVLLDAVNNLSDALSSIITIVGMKLATRAPDEKHPFGHGRIEHLSSVSIAALILMAGAACFRESVIKILHGEAAEYTPASLLIIAAAVAVKLLLSRYVKQRGEALNSEALTASGTDAAFDAVISLATLAAGAVSLLWHISIEGYLGIFISAVIIKAGLEILSGSLSSIIGERTDAALSGKVKAAIGSYPEVLGVYDLMLHAYGPEKLMGSAHIEVDEHMTAGEIDHLTRRIAGRVFRDFGIVLTVGIYACNTADALAEDIRSAVEALIARREEIVDMHGFYVEGKRVNFDLTFAFGSDAGAIRRELLEALQGQYPDYSFYIVEDTPTD